MRKLLKQSRLWELMERKDAQGNPQPFQLKFVKTNGEVKEYTECILTSMHSRGTTINVLPTGENRPRSITRITIIEFNKIPVYL